jgi:hypothetical protein
MERRSKRVSEQLAGIRKDWEQKRADPDVPGALAPEEVPADGEPESPGAEAPPPEAHPAEAEAPAETAVGPPADDGTADA